MADKTDMTERLTNTVTVISSENGDSVPDNLMELIAFLQEQLNRIPVGYHDAAVFETDALEDWDGYGYVATRIIYERPETDDEMLARLKDEQARSTAERDRDLAELARLKAKYEAGTPSS